MIYFIYANSILIGGSLMEYFVFFNYMHYICRKTQRHDN